MKRARLLVFVLAASLALAAQTGFQPVEHVSPAEAAAHLYSGVPQPVLPLEAMRKRISGSVCLEVTIARSGDVAAVQPISERPLLIAPAMEAVKQWKYYSFISGGTARTVGTEVCVDFPREQLPRRINRRSVVLLALALGSLVLCAWAWKLTVAGSGQTVRGVRFAIAIADLVAASLSALVYLGFGIAWAAYLWTGHRLLVGQATGALMLISAAATCGSVALQSHVAKAIVALASALMFCLWLLVAIASVAV